MSGFNKDSYPRMDFFKVDIKKEIEEEGDLDFALQKNASDIDPVNFKCYEFHCNFDIEEPTLLAIEFTPGIEFIKVLSPYRAFIGIGRLFDDEDVQTKVKRKISKILREDDILKVIKRMEKKKSEE